MRAILARIGLLTVGMAAIEIALAGDGGAGLLPTGALLVAGVAALVAGTASFIVPLLSGISNERTR